MKGNEFMKSKEFQLAHDSYTKSLEIDPNEASTYSNRALAFIKLKDFGKAI